MSLDVNSSTEDSDTHFVAMSLSRLLSFSVNEPSAINIAEPRMVLWTFAKSDNSAGGGGLSTFEKVARMLFLF